MAIRDEEQVARQLNELARQRLHEVEARKMAIETAQANWARALSDLQRDRRRTQEAKEVGVDLLAEGVERAKAALAVDLAESDARLLRVERDLADSRARLSALVEARTDSARTAERSLQQMVLPMTVDPPVITQKEFLRAQNSVPAWVVGAIIILGVAAVTNAQEAKGLTWPVVLALGLALLSTSASLTGTIHTIRRNRRIDRVARITEASAPSQA